MRCQWVKFNVTVDRGEHIRQCYWSHAWLHGGLSLLPGYCLLWCLRCMWMNSVEFFWRGMNIIFFTTSSTTGSPVWLSRGNGDGQRSAEMVNFTPYLTHNYELFDLKFGEGYYITWFTNPAKFDWDRISGSAPSWWWNLILRHLPRVEQRHYCSTNSCYNASQHCNDTV